MNSFFFLYHLKSTPLSKLGTLSVIIQYVCTVTKLVEWPCNEFCVLRATDLTCQNSRFHSCRQYGLRYMWHVHVTRSLNGELKEHISVSGHPFQPSPNVVRAIHVLLQNFRWSLWAGHTPSFESSNNAKPSPAATFFWPYTNQSVFVNNAELSVKIWISKHMGFRASPQAIVPTIELGKLRSGRVYFLFVKLRRWWLMSDLKLSQGYTENCEFFNKFPVSLGREAWRVQTRFRRGWIIASSLFVLVSCRKGRSWTNFYWTTGLRVGNYILLGDFLSVFSLLAVDPSPYYPKEFSVVWISVSTV